ncbi:MAG: bifunctional folylpolyglutamate synthase/dihydrofolate synthase [Firmicutes bacterium]|nr:bifunctional folylpolyglutamate synthase/dihydrofolate synthase [Bacillota bacterium]
MINWEAHFDPTIRPGLKRIAQLLARMGDPQRKIPVVHVAGTNGKGSTAAMIGQALAGNGHRVGMTVSPDLGHLNERVLLNGAAISDSELRVLIDAVDQAASGMDEVPTFFEAMIAVSFLAFERWQADIAVVEVGLGGRLDATNVVPTPLLTVITPIHYDHMEYLGQDIRQIAGEKAGILKAGSHLVLAVQTYPEAERMVLERAAGLAIPVSRPLGVAQIDGSGVRYQDEDGFVVRTGLLGNYQAENLATAWTAVRQLARLGWISDLARAGEEIAQTRWPGRFQVISQSPLFVIDGAHNLEAVQKLAETLATHPWSQYRWHLLFAALKDKPAARMVRILAPLMDSMTLTQVRGPRGLDPATLTDSLKGFSYRVVDDQAQAFARAWSSTEEDASRQALLVTGSLSFLAELRQAKIIP